MIPRTLVDKLKSMFYFARWNKEKAWCWHTGRALHDHCTEAKNEVNCDNDHCEQIWKYYIETCHRLRTISTTSGDNKLENSDDQNKFCKPDKYKQEPYTSHKIYNLYRK